MIKVILFDVGGTLVKDNFLGNFIGNVSGLCDGVKEYIPLLEKKYELYLATRYPKSLQEKILKHHGLEKFVKFIKQEPPAQKPDPEFFIWLLKKINCQANETIMVGDSLEIDIIPAKALGIKTILISKENIFDSGAKNNASDWQAQNFSQAAKILLSANEK